MIINRSKLWIGPTTSSNLHHLLLDILAILGIIELFPQLAHETIVTLDSSLIEVTSLYFNFWDHKLSGPGHLEVFLGDLVVNRLCLSILASKSLWRSLTRSELDTFAREQIIQETLRFVVDFP